MFDRYVAIDWSASATPKTGRDSIWIADLRHGGTVDLSNPSTRAEAATVLSGIVDGQDGGRVLVGIDASFGYPQGSAAHFGLSDDPPWLAMWTEITALANEDVRNRNNRFEVAAALNRRAAGDGGPFWGCPHDDLHPALERTKPPIFEVSEFRTVEALLRTGGRYPKSAWQLLGAGSVGSQTLTLIPVLYRLLDRIGVWPFTTGLQQPHDRVVVAEVWPGLFLRHVPVGMIPDAAQVVATAEAMRDADTTGELPTWFTPRVDDPAPVEREEGWILGVVEPAGRNRPS